MWLLLGIQKLRLVKSSGYSQRSAEDRHKELIEKLDDLCNAIEYELPNKIRDQFRDDIADALTIARAKDVLQFRRGDVRGPDTSR